MIWDTGWGLKRWLTLQPVLHNICTWRSLTMYKVQFRNNTNIYISKCHHPMYSHTSSHLIILFSSTLMHKIIYDVLLAKHPKCRIRKKTNLITLTCMCRYFYFGQFLIKNLPAVHWTGRMSITQQFYILHFPWTDAMVPSCTVQN